MALFQLHSEQKLNASISEVWEFISSPQNLKEITPDYMGFNISSSNLPDKMHPGMIISYIVKPVLGISTTWVTEITHVDHEKFFVDEQRIGPYRIWHHQHHIKKVDDGVLMNDIVSYEPPFGFIGSIANSLFIKNKLLEIFRFREARLDALFNDKKETNSMTEFNTQSNIQFV